MISPARIQRATVPDLIRRLMQLIDYEAYLKKSHSDWESRWENIQELINFAEETSGVMGDVSPVTADPLAENHSMGDAGAAVLSASTVDVSDSSSEDGLVFSCHGSSITFANHSVGRPRCASSYKPLPSPQIRSPRMEMLE